MDDNRFDPLTNAALDRELAALLDVAPSPEFRARVRMRVDSVPMRGARLIYVLPAAAVVALAGMVYVGSGLSRPGEVGVQGVSSRHADIGLLEPPGPTVAPRNVVIPRTPVERPSAPRVVISPAEAEGIRALERAAAAGLVTSETFEDEPPIELMALDAISMEPLQALVPLEQE